MRQKGVAHYEGFCFRPGQPDEKVKIGDDLFFNLYRPPTITPLDGEPEIFLRHMDYLIADHASREAALDVLAWKVQHIGEKMIVAVLLVGPNRTGKSWLLDLPERDPRRAQLQRSIEEGAEARFQRLDQSKDTCGVPRAIRERCRRRRRA